MKNKILNEIKNEILSNKKELKKLFEIDSKYNSNIFDIEKLEKIINSYDNDFQYLEKEKSIGIIYFGHIEFTIYVSIYAIMNNIKLTLFIQDYFALFNNGIITIINKVLKEYKIKNEIQIYNMYSWKKISEIAKEFDKLICFGDQNSYLILKSMNIKNLVNFRYGIDIFKESKEFDELSSKIVNFAYKLGIEVQVIEDVEELLQYNNTYCTLIFSKKINKEKLSTLKQQINSKYFFVNENPFSKLKIDYTLIDLLCKL